MPNDDLFVRVLAQIEATPDAWNQYNWARRGPDCGTQYCIAGWACTLSGRQVQWYRGLNGISGTLEDGHSISFVAADLLGLTERQAHRLFHLPTDLDRVYENVARVLGLDETVLRDKVQAERAHPELAADA